MLNKMNLVLVKHERDNRIMTNKKNDDELTEMIRKK